jgi:hypothetical protein
MPTKCRDSDPLLGGVLYAGGSYSEGGSYMLVNTVWFVGVFQVGFPSPYH